MSKGTTHQSRLSPSPPPSPRVRGEGGRFFAFCIGLLLSTSCFAADWVWWEGEAAVTTNMPARSDFSPIGAEADVLSGGDWLSVSGPRRGDAARAKYDVTVPAEKTYHLWSRKFWKHGPFRWRFDDEPWQICPHDVALAESQPIRQHVEASWVNLGDVKLKDGRHTFQIELLAQPGEQQTAAFDCFLLTPTAFFPTGKLKPGETSGLTELGRFSYEPAVDPFTADALLDLRPLNEKTAGMNGPVRRDGDKLKLGDGTPVRFWAVNVSIENAAQDRASVDYLARKLAKLGVNMVRFHSGLFDDADVRKIDPKKLDHLHYLVAALRREGIYTTISFYFPLWVEMTSQLGVPGYDALQNKKPFGLVYFEPTFQQVYRGWLDAILSAENPYTKKSLSQDPAVAVVELVNEDSLFFHTFTQKNVPAPAWAALEKRFAAWLQARGERPAKLLDVWHMTGDGIKQGGDAKRRAMSLQARFLAETQKGFFNDTTKHLRDDLGYAGLVDCGNWKTADPALLEAIERWTYEAGDVIDRHGYFGPKLTGDASGYAVRVGQQWEDRSGLTTPERLPIWMTQQDGYPSIISEMMWTQPSAFRAEATALTTVFASLQGIDGVYFFAQQSNAVRDTTLLKFQVGSPAIAATFPAAALAFRRGDFEEAAPRYITASDDELFSLSRSFGFDAQAFDELRAEGDDRGQPSEMRLGERVVRTRRVVPPKATGVTKGGRRPGAAIVRQSRSLSASSTKTVVFAGQLNGTLLAGGVKAESGNDHGSIFFTSLDDQPMATSKKLFVQAMTDDRPHGFRAENGKITSVGQFPFSVTDIDLTITLPGNASTFRITTLDANGYARSTRQARGAIKIERDALYTIVERD